VEANEVELALEVLTRRRFPSPSAQALEELFAAAEAVTPAAMEGGGDDDSHAHDDDDDVPAFRVLPQEEPQRQRQRRRKCSRFSGAFFAMLVEDGRLPGASEDGSTRELK
jgi:hypothetical protein